MKKLICLVLCIAAAVAIISCGGDGATKSFSRAALSVQNMQRFSFLSMANSGLGFIGFNSGGGTTGSGTGGTSGGGIGGGGGYSSIGGFVRNFGGPNGVGPSMPHRTLIAGTTGTTGNGTTTTTGGDTSSTTGGDTASTTGGTDGGGGGTGGEYFYYDEWLMLWVNTQWTETSFSSTFFVDQAKTQPAGFVTSTFAGNWNVFPQTYTSDYAFTAGTLVGSHGTYHSSQTSEFDGSMTYNNTYSDTSHDQGSSTWSATGSSWQSRWDGTNGGWYEDSGSFNANGTGTYTCSSSEGWSSTWHYNADGSGNAHFEGPDPMLPADMTWTAAGVFHIVFADGTSETWTWSDLWEGNGEGTSGSTGGPVGAPRPTALPAPKAEPEKKADPGKGAATEPVVKK